MGQNFTRRFYSLIATALFAFVVSAPLLRAAQPDAGAGAKGRETPQTLVATYNEAVGRKDWKTCYLCCDAKWRANLLGAMFHDIAMSHDEKLIATRLILIITRCPGVLLRCTPGYS
jgi:hypothetical protein